MKDRRNRSNRTDGVQFQSPSRRRFLKVAGAGAAGAIASTSLLGCSEERTRAAAPAPSTTTASTGPETPDLRFGMIALTDCSPLVIAHEKGIFRKYGINATLVKGASWAAIRDSLSNGDIQATHMLLGMPLASTMGIGGSPRVPMIAPWQINRNGQGISLANEFKGKVSRDPHALTPLVMAAKDAGSLMTFAMTFPTGTHAMWMRYFLGAGGIHPDRDVALVTIPPPQMVANMRVGRMKGFCVGEPWNARAIADQIGFTAITTQQMWADHPEKVLAFREDFAQRNPRTVKAVLKAMYEASVWLDDMRNRDELASIIGRTTYVNCAPELIAGRLKGQYDYGDGRTEQDSKYMIFHDRDCNAPQAKYAKWFLSQFRRWGFTETAPDYDGISRRVMRYDLYSEALRELGVTPAAQSDAPETLFDGKTFDPRDPEGYARSFDVHALKGV